MQGSLYDLARCSEPDHSLKKRNYTFASVHDSFWTHASDIDGMNEVLRKAFVDLHTAPILETLRSEVGACAPRCLRIDLFWYL